MKRIILLAVVALAVHAAIAQNSNVHFGIKAGVNLANFNDEAAPNFDTKVGFNVGGLAHIHLTRQFAVQPELVFSAQGSEAPNGTKYKLNYINVPVLGQFMFGDGFRVQTGPQLGILTSSEVKANDVEIDVDDAYKKTDFAWSFGAGYLSKTGLGVDARYNLGISDVSKTEATDLKNRVWQIGLFYQFKH
jgi:hypothetical protein